MEGGRGAAGTTRDPGVGALPSSTASLHLPSSTFESRKLTEARNRRRGRWGAGGRRAVGCPCGLCSEGRWGRPPPQAPGAGWLGLRTAQPGGCCGEQVACDSGGSHEMAGAGLTRRCRETALLLETLQVTKVLGSRGPSGTGLCPLGTVQATVCLPPRGVASRLGAGLWAALSVLGTPMGRWGLTRMRLWGPLILGPR